ncbi:ankyrin repeat domain-containing protein 40 isoform X1 [Copidosoma floridanum]|uniref:ankyrin repeat domain-containing protein 40 isoform X1 n=1 Tax=Copidosoma floridanum TaxID=29053 RepID=UPI0006C9837F|nr:ankyrin repeat domain-containing protein 40 isoform X1 [Copidosoma floridanum]
MDEKRILEEQLREAACIGDTDAVQELINLGVDVNHAINGWTPLHWACKRNYLDVVALLLKSGADRNVKSDKGATPASVSTNPYILQLLADSSSTCLQDSPSFAPAYLKNPPLSSRVDMDHPYQNKAVSCEELVLKIRIENSSDTDFIEVDLPCNALTYQNLIKLCCDELGINQAQIAKLRKLPNTRIRRDKDVDRLQNYQEIEVVLHTPTNFSSDTGHKSMQHANGSTVPITPTNSYQSISKKDQTILY